MAHMPLEGIRVVDHTIAWAGPQATQLLADMGAEVIKIEAINRVDVMRGGGRRAGKDDKFWERGGWFIQLNRNKLDITIDLSQKAGKELYFKLVAISDVVIDNFTPRVMPNLGLDYEDLKKIKPDIIVLRMPGYGTTGPYRDAPAFGDCINAFCGLDDITGYPNGGPLRPGIAWGDPTSGIAAAFAILAAVHYRSVTGEGQYLEVSHLEASSNAMDGLLDYAMNRRVQKRMGNRDNFMAPQGCYPCKGDDQWITITIADDSDWVCFGTALGNPQWSKDPRFVTVAGRRKHHDELDKLIGTSTRSYDRYEIADLLQRAGIAAAPLLHPGELLKDPHYVERGFFEESDHPCEGKLLLPGMVYKMSETPCCVRTHAPLLGQHNEYVYKELLGLSKEEMEELTGKGIIGTEPLFDIG